MNSSLKCIWDNPDLQIVFVDHLSKNKERIQKFKEARNSRYIYQKELDKPCLKHDKAYGDFKDLTRRAASDKIFRDKAFNIAKKPKNGGYQRGIASMVYKLLIKKPLVVVLKMRTFQTKNYLKDYKNQLLEKLRKETW